MRTPDRQSDSHDGEQAEPSTPSKKTYRTPRLVTYGSLPELALAKGGSRADGGGNPQSKV